MPLFYFIILIISFLFSCQEIEKSMDSILLETSESALTAYCEANVNGVGTLDVETEYLPRVVNCENGGAPLEALKAQAVAARTYLYYKLETSGSINDGQSDQVYGCQRNPSEIHYQAVRETAGQVLRYNNKVIASFYVAGAIPQVPSCIATPQDTDPTSTEEYVTYNEGNRGAQVEQSTLGWVNANNYRNRGCKSQNGAKCLANQGRSYDEILRFYYGEDIDLTQANGDCIDQTMVVDQGMNPMVMDASMESINDMHLTPSTPDQSMLNQSDLQMIEEDENTDQNLLAPNTPTMIDPITSACILDRQFEMLRHDINCAFHECQDDKMWIQDGEGNLKVESDLLMPSCSAGWKIKITATGNYELRVWTPTWFTGPLEVSYVVFGGRYASSLKVKLERETWSMLGKFAFMAGDQIEIKMFNQNTVVTELPISTLMVREESIILQQEQSGQDPTLLNPFAQPIEDRHQGSVTVAAGCQNGHGMGLGIWGGLLLVGFYFRRRVTLLFIPKTSPHTPSTLQ